MGDDLSISKHHSGDRRQLRDVKRIFAHPNYEPVRIRNDIAVLVVRIYS